MSAGFSSLLRRGSVAPPPIVGFASLFRRGSGISGGPGFSSLLRRGSVVGGEIPPIVIVEPPGGSGSYPRRKLRIVDPNQRRNILSEDDALLLDLVRKFLELRH